MKLPWRRRKFRGKSKSPEQRLKEETAKLDSYLAQQFLRELKRNPDMAREFAVAKFGLAAPADTGGEYYEQPDLLSVLRQAKEAKNLLKDEIEPESKGSWLHDIIRALPSIPAILAELRESAPQLAQLAEIQQTRQQIQRPQRAAIQPHREPEGNGVKIEEVSESEGLITWLDRILEAEPAEVAAELHANKDKEGDIRSIVYQKMITSSFDELLALIPQAKKLPFYELISEYITNLDEEWLKAVWEEVNRLENVGK